MYKTVKEADVKGKRVLVRTGMDVIVDDNGKIADDSRVYAAIPTIKYLLEKNARVILLTHIGRPKGKVVAKYSVKNAAKMLSKLLGKNVKALDDCIGKKVEAAVKKMEPGEIIFLENLRFHKEEKENDKKFAKTLASYGDVYVNDAFSNSHHDGVSMIILPKLLPAFAGLLLEKELNALHGLFSSPERPLVAVLGGAKLSDKLGVVKNLLKKVDKLVIGGALAFTFFKAQGLEIGKSKCDDELVVEVKTFMNNTKLLLPIDIVVAKEFANSDGKVVDYDKIPANSMGLDIGPKSIKLFKEEIKKANSVVWSGDMGVFEFDKFAKGTREIAKSIASCKGTTVIGGGDTLLAAQSMKILDKFGHASTGGSAMLRVLEGKPLVAVEALKKA